MEKLWSQVLRWIKQLFTWTQSTYHQHTIFFYFPCHFLIFFLFSNLCYFLCISFEFRLFYKRWNAIHCKSFLFVLILSLNMESNKKGDWFIECCILLVLDVCNDTEWNVSQENLLFAFAKIPLNNMCENATWFRPRTFTKYNKKNVCLLIKYYNAMHVFEIIYQPVGGLEYKNIFTTFIWVIQIYSFRKCKTLYFMCLCLLTLFHSFLLLSILFSIFSFNVFNGFCFVWNHFWSNEV